MKINNGVQDLKIRDTIVAYIDILGFSDLIKDSRTDEAELNRRLNHFHRALNPSFSYLRNTSDFTKKHSFSEQCNVRIFSDNVAFTWELSTQRDGDIEIWQVLKNLAFYQSGLAIEGYFSRGAIEIGKLFADETVLFGCPLIEVVNLEKKASFPRIIFGRRFIEKVIPKLSSNTYYRENSPFNDLILKSIDGEYFLNYLYTMKEMNDDMISWDKIKNKKYYQPSLDELVKHKMHILDRLTKFESDSDQLRKFQWLCQYHDYFCSEFFPEDKTLIIEEMNSFKAFKKIIN